MNSLFRLWKIRIIFTRIDHIVSYDVDLSGQWTSNIDHGHVTNYKITKEEVVTTALIIFIKTVMNNKDIFKISRVHTCIQNPFYKTLPVVLTQIAYPPHWSDTVAVEVTTIVRRYLVPFLPHWSGYLVLFLLNMVTKVMTFRKQVMKVSHRSGCLITLTATHSLVE